MKTKRDLYIRKIIIVVISLLTVLIGHNLVIVIGKFNQNLEVENINSFITALAALTLFIGWTYTSYKYKKLMKEKKHEDDISS